MVECPSCGTDNPNKAKYCSKCGAPIAATEAAPAAVKPVPHAKVITPIARPTAPTRVPSIGMCFYHPNLRATYICNRCGRPICSDCAKPHGDLVFCPQCYTSVVPQIPTPTQRTEPIPTQRTEPIPPPTLPSPPSRAIVGPLFSIFGGLLVIFNAVAISWFPNWVVFVSSWWPTVSEPVLISLGVLSGICILLGAAIMYQPAYEKVGASLVVAFSVISLISMGGLFIGLILGVVGAILGTLKK